MQADYLSPSVLLFESQQALKERLQSHHLSGAIFLPIGAMRVVSGCERKSCPLLCQDRSDLGR